ncbi:hypothetical protein PCC9214_05784 [Planktothrix tepida]|uniref:VWFA domain-containing protein n=1 Tax=Planktothrix tepida PCC 9214 TaxID=671072 RepID=A0A1J1LSJ9_9CYAN|nr:hypothetical protein [Planktothrix tepida]CAD5990390.1 hypothetical protein PCC9214_05784 [Planktothrix tepida]CUR35375.1 hypothetical protein PL9214670001 [Planktothrix tepida PCC 9214]
MSRTYSRRHYQPSVLTPNLLWWKSPLILGAILAGISIIGITLWIEYTTQRVIHIRADDSSDSAEKYGEQRQQHCQASVHHYKPGDVAITIPFADRPVTTKNISIGNSLSLVGQCKDTQRPIKSEQLGTSLVLLLERIQGVVQKQRSRQNLNPVVVTITIQDAEPGQNQPKLDLNRVKELVYSITANKGAVAFMVEDEELQNQLDNQLSSEGDIQVCSFKNISDCVNWGFETGRNLGNK